MISVGVRELKARLSSYIGIARGGEEVVVTARGREVAILVLVTKKRLALKRLSEGGEARMPGGKPKGAQGVKIKGIRWRIRSSRAAGDPFPRYERPGQAVRRGKPFARRQGSGSMKRRSSPPAGWPTPRRFPL